MAIAEKMCLHLHLDFGELFLFPGNYPKLFYLLTSLIEHLLFKKYGENGSLIRKVITVQFYELKFLLGSKLKSTLVKEELAYFSVNTKNITSKSKMGIKLITQLKLGKFENHLQ